jgi:signal transduction histidine kinase
MVALGRWQPPASLGAKLLLILTAVGLAGAVAITLLLAAVITPSFNQLEAKAVDAHVDRTRAALGEYISKVESAVRDYGDWNSSYDYMAHPNAKFERESFSTLAMANLDVNGMAYVGNDGHIVIARWLDLNRNVDEPGMRRALVQRISQINFARALRGHNSAAFYTRLGPIVAAVGVAQVRRSDGTGTPRGYVMMVRQITSKQLSTLLQIKAKLESAAAFDAPVITPGHALMGISVPIPGIDGHGVAAVHFSVPRDVSLLGQRMLLLAVAGSSVLLLVVLIMLRRMIAHLVLRPLHQVEQHMQVVTASGSLSPLDQKDRRDEIGSLGRSFNTMLRQLKDLREQVEVQSFALGPISTILSRGIAQAPPSDRALVERALAELATDGIPAARRQKLAAFVAAAVTADGDDRDNNREQLIAGREALQHVLEIIGTQQAQAHERPPLEICDVTDIVARNATIARYAGGTAISFAFPETPHLVMANRVILSQVIGNLFNNAAEAIAARGTASGTIAVTVENRADGHACIMIRDDGEGFSPEVGATLFQRGYSTRSHKSGGLGLHWCANSMNAMEGSLRLESDGKGHGAVAVLTLKSAEKTAVEMAA